MDGCMIEGMSDLCNLNSIEMIKCVDRIRQIQLFLTGIKITMYYVSNYQEDFSYF